ncbi:MAG: hypothetical protein R3C68_12680 [Myxococcota bacterium]
MHASQGTWLSVKDGRKIRSYKWIYRRYDHTDPCIFIEADFPATGFDLEVEMYQSFYPLWVQWRSKNLVGNWNRGCLFWSQTVVCYDFRAAIVLGCLFQSDQKRSGCYEDLVLQQRSMVLGDGWR